MSILFHVTPRRNLDSILQLGISPEFATGPVPWCWFVSASKRAWAVAHVADRHDVSPSEIVVLRVSLSPSRIVRRRRGVWTTNTVVRSILSVSLPCAA